MIHLNNCAFNNCALCGCNITMNITKEFKKKKFEIPYYPLT